MSERESLKHNPFLTFFTSIDAAKKNKEKTKRKLDSIRKPSTNGPRKNLADQKDVIVNDFLQRVFLFTLNADASYTGNVKYGGVPKRCVKLAELAQEHTQLNENNISQALMERLQCANPVIFQLNYHERAPMEKEQANEDLLVQYLYQSYKRLVFEETQLIRSIQQDKQLTGELKELTLQCKKLISSYTGSILLQPDIFPTNNTHLQIFNICMRIHDDFDAGDFLEHLVKQYTDSDDLRQMFRVVLQQILERSTNLTLLHPDVSPLLEILIFFSKNHTLTWMVLRSDHWLPPQHNRAGGLLFATHSLIGRFLSLSAIPNDQNTPPVHFLEPSRQNEAEMTSVTNNIRQQTNSIVSKLHQWLYNVVLVPDAKHEVLYWFGMCLHKNRDRSKMYVDASLLAPGGFFVNFTHLLLMFCQPFLDVQSKLLLRIDCRYAATEADESLIRRPDTPLHCVGFHALDMMAQKPADVQRISTSGVSFKFTSEIFYLTQMCFRCGYVKEFEAYQELMTRLQKMSVAYQEARQQNAVGSMIEEFKNNFENGMRLQLSMKAVLLNPVLSDLCLQFCVVTSYWLVQQTLAGKEYLDTRPRQLKPKSLSDETPPALTVVPELFIENIGDTLRMMGYFNEEVLERSKSLEYLMEFFAVFLGTSARIKNPHLRAKLAESLAAFLPKEKNQQNSLFSYSFRKNSFENSPVVPKLLPQALLQLFVDIEFTGDAMEFQQKFTYRHYMYAILEYVWNIPSYHATFDKLYKEGKTSYKNNMEFSSFPRFINLLVNDSTFLLDEGLQHLILVKDLEQQKSKGEWENLSHDERRQKEQTLQQYTHMAKGYNRMANETVHVLCYITRDIPRPFASPCMVDGMAAFLNYFLVHLVGPKRRELKVANFEKYNFEPQKLVLNILKIYLSLGREDDFCRAVAKDSRSYSNELFVSAVELLQKFEGCGDMARDLEKMRTRLEKWYHKLRKDQEDMPEPPEEFIDPISCEMMFEPVQLPSSGKIMCKTTIAKHLLSDEKDPFNRMPLRLDQVIPCYELKAKIMAWMTEHNVQLPTFSSGDCGG